MYYKINAHELLRRVLFVMPLRWLQLSLCENKWIRTNTIILMGDATHLGWIHATTALALATTFEHLHFTILLHEHRLCIWLPANSYAYAHPGAHIWWHAAAANRTQLLCAPSTAVAVESAGIQAGLPDP